MVEQDGEAMAVSLVKTSPKGKVTPKDVQVLNLESAKEKLRKHFGK